MDTAHGLYAGRGRATRSDLDGGWVACNSLRERWVRCTCARTADKIRDGDILYLEIAHHVIAAAQICRPLAKKNVRS